MNFLCHALPYLDDPLVAVATGIPDWLSLVNRKIRARGRVAETYLESDDPILRSVAMGIYRHIEDDRWFHETRAFAELNLQFAVELRDLLPGDAGFRPTFVGHVLVEMLLDALWIRDDPKHCERYYATIKSVASIEIQDRVDVITGKSTEGLLAVMQRFAEIQFLFDYAKHEGLLFRMNQVLHRVKLPPLPDTVLQWLPRAEKLVESRRGELLCGPDDQPMAFPFPSTF